MLEGTIKDASMSVTTMILYIVDYSSPLKILISRDLNIMLLKKLFIFVILLQKINLKICMTSCRDTKGYLSGCTLLSFVIEKIGSHPYRHDSRLDLYGTQSRKHVPSNTASTINEVGFKVIKAPIEKTRDTTL